METNLLTSHCITYVVNEICMYLQNVQDIFWQLIDFIVNMLSNTAVMLLCMENPRGATIHTFLQRVRIARSTKLCTS